MYVANHLFDLVQEKYTWEKYWERKPLKKKFVTVVVYRLVPYMWFICPKHNPGYITEDLR